MSRVKKYLLSIINFNNNHSHDNNNQHSKYFVIMLYSMLSTIKAH